jgi:lipid A 3-O-deacylase
MRAMAARNSPGLRFTLPVLLLFLSFCASFAHAQATPEDASPVRAETKPEDGGRELEVWTGGGHSVPGGRSDSGVWNLGVRYGWILTGPHGPGFLKGRFEYAVDAVPAFWVFQPAGSAYGAGFDPLNLKWVLATRGGVAPYLELSGGTLFTNHDVPTGTNNVNFTSSAAIGIHILRESFNWSIEARYMHISNAGLAAPNPGMNTVQVRLGIGKFLRCKH